MIVLYLIRCAKDSPIIDIMTIEYDAAKFCAENHCWYDPLVVRVR